MWSVCQNSSSSSGLNQNATLINFYLFNDCAQHTVLLWIPCAIFWFCSPLELWRLLNVGRKHSGSDSSSAAAAVALRWCKVVKCRVGVLMLTPVCVCCLSALTVVQHMNRHTSSSLTTITSASYAVLAVTLSTMVYVSVLLQRKARSSSVALWLTLFALCTCGTVEFFTTVSGLFQEQISAIGYCEFIRKVCYVVYYVLIVASLILHSFSPMTVEHLVDGEESDQPIWPERSYSLPGQLYFTWFSEIMWIGFKRAIEVKEMFRVAPEEQAENISDYFADCLDREFRSAIRQNRFTWKESDDEIDVEVCQECMRPSLLRVLFKSFGVTCCGAALMKLLCDLLLFAEPYFLQTMIRFSTDFTQPWWHGLLYVFVMALVILVRTQAMQRHFYVMNRVGVRAKTAFVSAIYRKSLKMTSEARKRLNTGEIVNLMAIDATKFKDIAPFIQMVWSGPLQVVLALIYLSHVVGTAVYAAIGVLCTIFVINIIACKFIEKMNVKQMKEKDNRMKLLSEVLNAIKVIKLYAWELAFQRRIEDSRAKELRYIKKASYFGAVTAFSWSCSQLVVCLSVFYFYDGILTPGIVFSVLTLTSIIDFPLSIFPMVVADIATLRVSMKRLNDFFSSQELMDDNSTSKMNKALIPEKLSVYVDRASFTWESDLSCVLSDINLRIPRGSLVAVVGKVGSGKSSLLSALCGELHKVQGTVGLNGSIAYASQQAWIQNMTVRDNVLFAQPFNKPWYDRVVDACALTSDLLMLPSGDLTEIGERGINLSGGQKQRISLARTVYQDSDIYLLDDPLSAVDIHVGKHIFERVVGPSGLLKDKTRILVTHGLSFLPLCDLIVVMKDGCIEEIGHFHDLVEQEGAFSEIVQQYFTEGLSDEEMDELQDSHADLTRFSISRYSDQGVTGNNIDALNLKKRHSVESIPNGHSKEPKQQQQQHQQHLQPQAQQPDSSDDEDEEGKLIDTEEVFTGKVSWSVYLKYLQASGPVIILYLCFAMLTEGSVLVSNIWLQIWSDSDLAILHNDTNSNFSARIRRVVDKPIVTINEGLLIYGSIGLCQMIFIAGMVFCFARFQVRAGKLLHTTLISSILRAPISFFDTTPSGRILNRCGKDINTIDTQIPLHVDQVVHFIFITLAALTGVVYATPYFAVALIPGALLYYMLQQFYVTSSRQFRRLEAVTRSPVYSHFSETLHGVATIRAFNQQERFFKRSCYLLDLNNSFSMGLIVSNRWVGVRLDLISLACVFISAMIVVVLRDYGLSPGVTGLAISLCLSTTDIYSWGVQETSALETEIVAIERISEYCDAPSEANWEAVCKIEPKNWPVYGKIEFVDYCMRYRPGLPLVLKNLTCSILPGQKVGIVGRTGAGKSSLTLALFRLIEPAGGKIRIDDIDISLMGLHEIRRKITIIPQDPVLFSGTLRMNIDPFNCHTDYELWKALELSNLKEFVSTLPDLLIHQIGEGGANLSLGQRQLLCLARAILRKSKVLILDEATAAVDLETDAYVQETIRVYFKDCTILTIAHRINTVLDYDRIMVFDQGRLIEYDTPDTLLANENSLFAKMVYDTNKSPI